MYGEPAHSALLQHKRPVTPDDFTGTNIADFAARVADYQLSRMRKHWESDAQLREVAGKLPDPSLIYCPYFYMRVDGNRARWQKWLDLNLNLARAFVSIQTQVPKHSVICIDSGVLAKRDDLLHVAREYAGLGYKGCWVWFSKMMESELSVADVRNLAAFAEVFRGAAVELYNFHGGFLSAVLSKFGMTGLSHGVGYGESKDVVPVVGVTVPTVNYHVPPLHVRISMLELERALTELGISTADDFHAQICDCTVCKGVLKGDLTNVHEFGDAIVKVGNSRESQTPDSAKKCRFHYLLARKKELEWLAAASLGEVKEQLLRNYRRYSSLPAYLGLRNKADHLRTWATAIEAPSLTPSAAQETA